MKPGAALGDYGAEFKVRSFCDERAFMLLRGSVHVQVIINPPPARALWASCGASLTRMAHLIYAGISGKRILGKVAGCAVADQHA